MDSLIQTLNLNVGSPHAGAIKLGATASAYQAKLEYHVSHVRFLCQFTVAMGQNTTEHQIVVNVQEVLGTDVEFDNNLQGAIGAVLPATSMPESAAPQAQLTGNWYYQSNGNIRIRGGYTDPDTGQIAALTVVTMDCVLPFRKNYLD